MDTAIDSINSSDHANVGIAECRAMMRAFVQKHETDGHFYLTAINHRRYLEAMFQRLQEAYPNIVFDEKIIDRIVQTLAYSAPEIVVNKLLPHIMDIGETINKYCGKHIP